MVPSEIMTIVKEALVLVLILSLPILGVALLTSILIGIFQAFTKFSEPAVSQIARVVAVLSVLLVVGPWVAGQVVSFTSGTWMIIQHVVAP